MSEPTLDGWHLDKRVPISIITAIVFQTFALGWYVSSLDSRIANLESGVTQRADERDRLIVLETELRGVGVMLRRIERQLERLPTLPPPRD